jgi:hypothetical protein
MKFIKLFENFEIGYTLGDVLLDSYEINYVLDEQNITAYYSFSIYSDLNSNLVTHQIGTTDPENSEVLINKLEQFINPVTSLKDLLKSEFGIGDMITISFFDNSVNKYKQVEDINDDNRGKFNSYFNLLKDHLEPFSGLSIDMKPHKIYTSSAPVLTIIIKKIK